MRDGEPKVAQARSGSDFAAARALFAEYAERLGVDLCFQDFHAELDRLDSMYAPPTGCLLLAWEDDVPIGCVGLRRHAAAVCEMKRLYVRNASRGHGLGRRLARTLIERARELGYRRMLLDTLSAMTEARELYASLGFRECAPYYANPPGGVEFMELDLGEDERARASGSRRMQIIRCSSERHAPAILEILNEAILNSTALYEYRPLAPESMQSWFRAKEEGGFPVLGMEGECGELLGFATYGTFRARPAYKYSVEHSVYVRSDQRGRGVGGSLMRELIHAAVAQDRHVMVGGIDAENAASIAFHRKLGFEHAGTLRQVGYKFGRWLDLAFYQLVLPAPSRPTEE